MDVIFSSHAYMQALSGLCVLPPLEKVHRYVCVQQWNTHRIRQNRKAGCPSGVPNDLYELPQLEGNCALNDYSTTKLGLYMQVAHGFIYLYRGRRLWTPIEYF